MFESSKNNFVTIISKKNKLIADEISVYAQIGYQFKKG